MNATAQSHSALQAARGFQTARASSAVDPVPRIEHKTSRVTLFLINLFVRARWFFGLLGNARKRSECVLLLGRSFQNV